MKEFLLYFEVNIICIPVLGIIGLNIKHSEYSPGRRPRVMLKKAEKKEPDIADSIYKIGNIEYVNIVMQNDEISN